MRKAYHKLLANALAILMLSVTASGDRSFAGPDFSGIQRVQDRPEMRSYGRIPGLQLEGIPTRPPAQRGVRSKRPTTVLPTPVTPRLHRPGALPKPFSSQWYSYCARNYRSFEPRTGRYTTYSGERRLCR